MLKSALIYAKYLGWAVFPIYEIRADGRCACGKECTSPGKHPRIKNGVKQATTDLNRIRHWFTRWTSANMGIATGKASGFFVLDVDGEEGQTSLDALEVVYGKLPETVEAITGSGGRHILFKYTEGFGNSASALAVGLDIRTDGGYIVAAPSNHKSGKRYEWEASSYPVGQDAVPIAEAPEWLLKELRKHKNQEGGRCISKARGMDHWRHIIQGVGEGERNHSAASLAGYLLGRKVDPEITFQLLRGWNTFNHPPMEDDELFTTFKSILTKDQRQERSGYKIEY